jgi:hypothetical protein
VSRAGGTARKAGRAGHRAQYAGAPWPDLGKGKKEEREGVERREERLTMDGRRDVGRTMEFDGRHDGGLRGHEVGVSELHRGERKAFVVGWLEEMNSGRWGTYKWAPTRRQWLGNCPSRTGRASAPAPYAPTAGPP